MTTYPCSGGCGELLERRGPGNHPPRCDSCKKEHARVYVANYRARQIGAEASLTVEAWKKIVERAHRRCVYCGKPFEVLDHAEGLEAGTTRTNCVPACWRCNYHKKSDPSFKPKKRPTMKQRTDARFWKQWASQKLRWEPISLVRFGKALLANGQRPATVYQTLGQVNRIGVAGGFSDLASDPSVIRFRASLR